jgi:tetratricopeptide (TPR) repeat protein
MILEIIIIICVIIIFIILARRLPNLKNDKQDSTPSSVLKDTLPKDKPAINFPKIQFPKFNFGEKKIEKPQSESKANSDFWIDEKIELSNKSNFEKGDMFFEKGEYKEAEKYYIKAAAETPDNPKIYNRLGIIYLELKNFRDAKDAFGELLKFDDKKASRQINYGLACLNLKNYDEAIDAFEKAIKLDPKNKKYIDLLKDTKSKKRLFEKK